MYFVWYGIIKKMINRNYKDKDANFKLHNYDKRNIEQLLVHIKNLKIVLFAIIIKFKLIHEY